MDVKDQEIEFLRNMINSARADAEYAQYLLQDAMIELNKPNRDVTYSMIKIDQAMIQLGGKTFFFAEEKNV